MLDIKTQADLEQLIRDGTQESLTLDYKRSDALARDSKPRGEISKDVCAFANSAGGQIIYCIAERDRIPVAIDGGADPDRITREWLEQVIDADVQPRVEGLVITPIPLTAGGNGFVVSIPQAAARAPHQASDHRYYKRQNFQSVPMEDYEVRDVLRRATTPKLYLALSIIDGDGRELRWSAETRQSDQIKLQVLIGNETSEPAVHTVVTLFLDKGLTVKERGGLSYEGSSTLAGNQVDQYRRLIGPPTNFPIFREAQFVVATPHVGLALDREKLGEGRDFRFVIGYSLATPGFFTETHGEMLVLQNRPYLNLRGKREVRAFT